MLRSIRTIRNIPRLKDISFILLKHGFYQLASQLGAPFRFRVQGILRLPRGDQPTRQVERLRLAFQELGPLFIKLGQLIANRPDLFPPAMVLEFAKLEDRVAAVSFPEIRKAIQRELGADPSQYFAHIDEEPLASASMAQIHRARLLDGTEVVLKVQKPGIEYTVERDMEILALVAEALAGTEDFQTLDPVGLVAEMRRSMERELNFTFERNALERVRKNFDGDPVLTVPRTYSRLSGKRLLVMDYLDGTSIRKCELPQEERKRLARECARVFFQMVFRDGYFHADPHAGNILVLPNGRLGWVDFGSMGLFTNEMRGRLVRILRALLQRDYNKLARQLLKSGRPLGETALFDFSQDLAVRLDPYFGLTLREINVGDLFNTVMELARDHRITMPPGLILMTRALILMEGLTHKLDPDLDTMQELEPLARRYVRDRFRPDNLMEEAGDRLSEFVATLWEYPHYLSEILRKLSQGRLTVETHVQGLEGLNERLEQSSNRISQAVIFASLLVSSSMVMSLERGPTLFDLPLFGVLGYTAAGVMGAWVLFRIVRG